MIPIARKGPTEFLVQFPYLLNICHFGLSSIGSTSFVCGFPYFLSFGRSAVSYYEKSDILPLLDQGPGL